VLELAREWTLIFLRNQEGRTTARGRIFHLGSFFFACAPHPRVQWLQSYATDDRLYCLYIATNEEAVREHARQSGFPANRISEVRAIIDPVTGGA
jgi:hypothetical protein